MTQSRFSLRTLLFVSLALNLIAVGAVAGAAAAGVRVQRESPRALVERMPGPRAFMTALPLEIRGKLRDSLAASWSETRTLRRAALEARREAFAAAAEEPYDAERVRAAFARLRQADQAAIGVFQDRMADAFATLTPEERTQALAALRTAAPASRRSLAPQDETQASPDAPPSMQEQSLRERRQALREMRRQRRLERNP